VGLDVVYAANMMANLREFANACGAVEVEDDMAWHLTNYGTAMFSKISNDDSDSK
jgi:hypothetical protein